MRVRCFFVVDKIDRKEVKIACFPTEKMAVDCSSDPTQVFLFEFQRSTILGIIREGFGMHKIWHEWTLTRCCLWDILEADLDTM